MLTKSIPHTNHPPLALDLFCGAGAVCRGLQQAGYEVIGVDMVDQPDYPGTFIKDDALFTGSISDFDLVWASPPCQAFTNADRLNQARNNRWGQRPPDPLKMDLIKPTRALLRNARKSVMENVPGAPLRTSLTLSGKHFANASLLRRRIFEISGFDCIAPFPKPTPPSLWQNGGLWTQTHLNWIADNQPDFYRRNFRGIVCASGGGATTYRTINNRRAAGRWTETDGYRWLKRCTDLPELRAALDAPHVKTGTRETMRKALNNSIPAFYARHIAAAALRPTATTPALL